MPASETSVPKPKSDLTARVTTALIGAPVAVGLMWIGGWPFVLAVVLLALAAQYELFGMLEAKGGEPQRVLGLVLGAIVALHAVWPGWWVAAVVGVIALLVVELFRKKEQPLENLSGTLFSLAYPVLLLSFLIDLRQVRAPGIDGDGAFWLTLTTLLLVWATDTLAYFSGRAFGKHKLMPRVSPKKTWEGSIGGLLGAVGVGIVLKLLVLPFLSALDIVVIALICGALGQIGDLAESVFKRAAGVKDSGNLLPGHGGLLDRVDSLLFAVPLVYLYVATVVLAR